jgi:hypothetical protein
MTAAVPEIMDIIPYIIFRKICKEVGVTKGILMEKEQNFGSYRCMKKIICAPQDAGPWKTPYCFTGA